MLSSSLPFVLRQNEELYDGIRKIKQPQIRNFYLSLENYLYVCDLLQEG